MMVTTTIDQLLKSGIWETQENPAAEWRKWSASLSGSSFNVRGSARLVFDVGEDRITDLCDNAPEGITVNELVADRSEIKRMDDALRAIFTKPKKDSSWIDYRNSLTTERDEGYAPTRTMSAMPLTKKTDFSNQFDVGKQIQNFLESGITQIVDNAIGGGVGNNLNLNPNDPNNRAGRLENNIKNGETSADRRVRPQIYVIMQGVAWRVGYEIPEPTLETVNGVKLIPANRLDGSEYFKCEPIYRLPLGGMMVYKASWRRRFAPEKDLPDQPLPELPNPLK